MKNLLIIFIVLVLSSCAVQKKVDDTEHLWIGNNKMLIRIGHRISAIQKVKHYVKQRIKGDDIPEITGKGNSNPILYYKRPE